MNFTQVRALCTACWNTDKYGFVVIDKDSDINEGKDFIVSSLYKISVLIKVKY